MRQTTGGDAFFLYTDKPSRHQHISMLYVYDPSDVKDGPLRFKTILEQVEKRLGASPIFRQKLVQVPLNLDYPYWINDPDFDLEFHVRHIALPKPGDWRQFCIQVSRLHSRPLDLTRPVWEMYVIEGLDNIDGFPKGCFAIMTKIHHVALDGVAAAELTMGLHDTEPYPKTQKRPLRWRPEAQPSPTTLLIKAGFNNVRRSVQTTRTVSEQVGRALKKLVFEPFDRARSDEPPIPLTRFNQRISPHRVWDAARFPLDDFKTIKASVAGATINDVVLTVCGGALKRYLDSKHETPETSMTAMVPVSVRTADETGTAGNKIHLSRARLHSSEADPIQRLERVSREMQKLKQINAVSAREMANMQEELPAPTLLLAGAAAAASLGPGKAYRASHNTVVTNVPGPQSPLYFCGAKLVMFTGMAVIADNMGMSMAVTSYDGTLTIAPLSDRKMLPDPAFFRECLEASFNELKEAAKAHRNEAPQKQGKARRKSPTRASRSKTLKAKPKGAPRS